MPSHRKTACLVGLASDSTGYHRGFCFCICAEKTRSTRMGRSSSKWRLGWSVLRFQQRAHERKIGIIWVTLVRQLHCRQDRDYCMDPQCREPTLRMRAVRWALLAHTVPPFPTTCNRLAEHSRRTIMNFIKVCAIRLDERPCRCIALLRELSQP